MLFNTRDPRKRVINLLAIALCIAHARLQVLDNTANVRNLGLHIAKVLRRFIPVFGEFMTKFR